MDNKSMNLLRRLRNVIFTLSSKLGGKFFSKRYVFLLVRENELEFPHLEGEVVHTYSSMEQVPVSVTEEIYRVMGSGTEAQMRKLFSQNARAYVLLLNDTFGSIIWAKSGSDIRKWFVSLAPDDVVLFAGNTNPEFRGMHLHSHVIAVAHQTEAKKGYRCLADCNVSNLPSKRQLQRTGFDIIHRARVTWM